MKVEETKENPIPFMTLEEIIESDETLPAQELALEGQPSSGLPSSPENYTVEQCLSNSLDPTTCAEYLDFLEKKRLIWKH